jgi:hypothetical protein
VATTDQVRRAMHRQPFVPFTLRLADGTSYLIKHPDFIAVPPTPRGREATFYAEANGSGEAEYTTHLIDLGLVLEVIVPGELPIQPAAANPQS